MVLSHEVGSMERMRPVLTLTLVLLFLGLSFNAYACLIPLFTAAAGAMEAGCPAPEEQPARQFCDAFTTLGVQATGESHSVKEDHSTLLYGMAAPAPPVHLPDSDAGCQEHPLACPTRDRLITTTVLRL